MSSLSPYDTELPIAFPGLLARIPMRPELDLALRIYGRCVDEEGGVFWRAERALVRRAAGDPDLHRAVAAEGARVVRHVTDLRDQRPAFLPLPEGTTRAVADSHVDAPTLLDGVRVGFSRRLLAEPAICGPIHRYMLTAMGPTQPDTREDCVARFEYDCLLNVKGWYQLGNQIDHLVLESDDDAKQNWLVPIDVLTFADRVWVAQLDDDPSKREPPGGIGD